MKIINREMKSEVITTDKSQYSMYCQASFNSDGVITLRNYNINDKDSDEIIVLSTEETEAIFKLFSRIGQKNKNYDLPF
jgi:hypothetical protein